MHRWLRPDRIPGYCRCISGHFPRGKYAAVFPDATYITWLREPVERLLSSCHQHIRHKNPRDSVNVRIHEQGLSAEQAALLPDLHNQQHQFFDGFDTTDFAFVGIVEEFEKSMECFQKLFSLESLPPIPPRNINPQRTRNRYEIPADLRKRLEECNQADYTLYHKAQAELDALHARLCAES